jgi:hypothetical protein
MDPLFDQGSSSFSFPSYQGQEFAYLNVIRAQPMTIDAVSSITMQSAASTSLHEQHDGFYF